MFKNETEDYVLKFIYESYLPHPEQYHLGSRIEGSYGNIEKHGNNFYVIRPFKGKQQDLIKYVKDYSNRKRDPVIEIEIIYDEIPTEQYEKFLSDIREVETKDDVTLLSKKISRSRKITEEERYQLGRVINLKKSHLSNSFDMNKSLKLNSLLKRWQDQETYLRLSGIDTFNMSRKEIKDRFFKVRKKQKVSDIIRIERSILEKE